ncbi:hypothetical protein KUTeg_003376 [Tegillarca granosa]|uniref:Uncharacterized protein n=1 Tax=Tegillarca granosa TaxID=220873 RepID=A0ABQ9FRE9_TEGGR|nr:hypothetical protein KUTeg_003376 [Tegillarca granosa]
MWCEELGRLLLLRHQKNRAPDSKSPGMHPQIQKAMPPLPQGDPNGPWAPNNQGQPGQSLSVVTTVWGMTNSTQSGPFTHNTPGFTNTTMSSTTNYTQQAQGFPGNQIQKPPYGPQGMPYRQNSGTYQRPSGYPPTPNTPGSNTPISSPSEYPPAQGNPALSAALVAAAATATATATATASMVALHQEPNAQQMNVQMNMQNGAYPPQMQMHGQPPYGNQYPNMGQRPPGSMNMGQGPGPGPMMTKPGMVYQAPTSTLSHSNTDNGTKTPSSRL